jgi:hypothetical protein
MIDSYALLAANGVGVVSLTAFMYWLLATGRLHTDREWQAQEKRIATLEQALGERDGQLSVALRHLAAENSLMAALHQRAEEVSE